MRPGTVYFGKRYRHPKPIEPYILGAILGDGCITKSVTAVNSVQFTTMDDEIVQRFMSAGYDMGHYWRKSGNKAKSYMIYDRNLVDALKMLGLDGCDSADKFIPRQYKYAPVEERKQLVRGLMDTDGYVDGRGHMSYSTTSSRLAEDVAFVIRSLGGMATVKKNSAGYRDKRGSFIKCKDCYDVYFRTRMNPELVGLSRKKRDAGMSSTVERQNPEKELSMSNISGDRRAAVSRLMIPAVFMSPTILL